MTKTDLMWIGSIYIVNVIESAAYGVIMLESFASKTRKSEVRASEGF